MPYFRILVGLRGCYSDSSENEIHNCATPQELHAIIADRLAWHSETGEELDPTIEPCSETDALDIFTRYTGPKAPSLPTCAASWDEGRMGVLVSGATESEYAESELQSCEHWTAPESGTVYFLAPEIMACWVEYGAEGVEGAGAGAESECESYMRQAESAYDIPADGVVVTVSTESTWGFESLYAFSTPCGQTYRGSAVVLAYVPGLGG